MKSHDEQRVRTLMSFSIADVWIFGSKPNRRAVWTWVARRLRSRASTYQRVCKSLKLFRRSSVADQERPSLLGSGSSELPMGFKILTAFILITRGFQNGIAPLPCLTKEGVQWVFLVYRLV